MATSSEGDAGSRLAADRRAKGHRMMMDEIKGDLAALNISTTSSFERC
jgi:hypothetical protein